MLTYPGLASQRQRRPGRQAARTSGPATALVRRWRGRAWWLAGAALALAAAGCGGGPAGTPSVRLDAGPAVAALVDPVHVSISGLPPTGLVTVQARALDQEGQPWVSAAVFRASATGTLNLATAAPVSGSYHVADAGGLLWSLQPAPGTNQAMNALRMTQPCDRETVGPVTMARAPTYRALRCRRRRRRTDRPSRDRPSGRYSRAC